MTSAIILAAGRGTRLQPLFPEYMKPLLPVRGVPLLSRLAETVQPLVERTIVVASPRNAQMLSDVLPDHVELAIQRHANGPANALLAGLQLGVDGRVLLLLGDNVVEADDILLPDNEFDSVVTTKMIGIADANRYTVFNADKNIWTEKMPIEQGHLIGDKLEAWCGPLVFEAAQARRVFTWSTAFSEYLIGPMLHRLCPEAIHHTRDVIDIGTHYDWMKVNGQQS